MKKISILGVTGSIGTQTLDVIRTQKEDFLLIGISANKNYLKVIDIINEFNPKYVALVDIEAYKKVKEYCYNKKLKIEVLCGIEGLNTVATLSEIDIVVTSVVGMVGFIPTLKAIEKGKTIALANKETLVVGGEIIINAAKKNNVSILPIDSEHSAVFQCLQGNKQKNINKIILTASGGPFRNKKREELVSVTAEQALQHPNWSMGKKISIDSATLVNKGFEVIEAHWLFNTNYEDIQVVIHPQSIIHSMVEYVDGSVIAQLGSTDMCLPIQYALNYPQRKSNVVKKLDFYNLGNLTFDKPDINTFKGLRLSYMAGKIGGIMPTVLNAANEKLVSLFLNNRIKFLDIGDNLEECMDKFSNLSIKLNEENILQVDKQVRTYIENKFLL